MRVRIPPSPPVRKCLSCLLFIVYDLGIVWSLRGGAIMVEQIMPKPWYKKWWGILLTILFFPLIVPYLVWEETAWNDWIKIVVTAICVISLPEIGFIWFMIIWSLDYYL
jgi:hypothetical protein